MQEVLHHDSIEAGASLECIKLYHYVRIGEVWQNAKSLLSDDRMTAE